jgi:hypothetical protein
MIYFLRVTTVANSFVSSTAEISEKQSSVLMCGGEQSDQSRQHEAGREPAKEEDHHPAIQITTKDPT